MTPVHAQKLTGFSSLAARSINVCHIIPAAGEAARWKKLIAKELLPTHQGISLLQHHLFCGYRAGARRSVIVTTPSKISMHVQNMVAYPLSDEQYIFYTLQKNEGMWGAIEAALAFDSDYYLFSMPDTFIPEDAFNKFNFAAPLTFGLFETFTSNRFGIITDEVIPIQDKAHVDSTGASAWGIFGFSREVRDFWLSWGPYSNYTDPLNHACLAKGYETRPLKYYYDLSNVHDYIAFTAETPPQT